MKKHILLIDDDKDELKLFMEALDNVPGSFKCTYANCASQGLDMLNYLHPDFIFIDYNIPQVNGMEMLTEIKKDRRLADIPVFLYSTSIPKPTREAAMALGAAGCIEKPNTIGMLAVVLRSVVAPLDNPPYVRSSGK
jgi:CheY-like chemotaxis protein